MLLLFADAARVNPQDLRHGAGLPFRLLAIGLPADRSPSGSALAAALFTDLPWELAALLGAVLAPTDAALSASVVSDESLPECIRRSLERRERPQRRHRHPGRDRVHRRSGDGDRRRAPSRTPRQHRGPAALVDLVGGCGHRCDGRVRRRPRDRGPGRGPTAGSRRAGGASPCLMFADPGVPRRRGGRRQLLRGRVRGRPGLPQPAWARTTTRRPSSPN